MRFASFIVLLAIVNITVFTIIDIILLATIGVELVEIMPYFFAFWGGEMVMLAAIRIFGKDEKKINNDDENNG